MFPTIKLASLLLAASIVKAQTTTECDPLEKTCPNNPALPAKLSSSFSKGIPDGWRQVPCKGPVSYGPGGMSIGYKEANDCTSMETIGMALFGLFEVKMKAAPGKGIVSSVVLQSDVRDEVDWEFLGGEDYRVQTNYFGKGDTTTYDRMIYVPVPNNQADFHTYGVNWTSATITWTVDGAPVRTLNYADAKGGTRFPQTPARLKFGIWAAPADKPGIIEWAGGLADPSKGPFAMVVSDVNIVNYSPGKEYRYKDKTGNWDSIEVIPGVAEVGPGQKATESGTKKSNEASPASPMMPNEPHAGTSASASSSADHKDPNSSNVAATAASATSASNATASGSKSTAKAANASAAQSAAQSASGSRATSQFAATSAAIAGLSLLFFAFLL